MGHRHIGADGVIYIIALGNEILPKFRRRVFVALFSGAFVDVVGILNIGDGLGGADFRILIQIRHIAVVVRINGHGDGVAALPEQGCQVALHNRQLFKQAFVQPFNLSAAANQLSPAGMLRQFRFRCFRGAKVRPFPAPLRLGHPADGPGNFISAAGEGLGGVRCYFLHGFRREITFSAVGVSEIVGAADDKVCAGLFCQIFFHIKPIREGHQHIQKHHGQRKGDHHKNGLALVPPQIGESHLMDFGATGGTVLFSGLHRFRVLRRFHRRNLRGDSSGTGAGQQYRDQCKQCGSKENQRGGTDGCNAGTEGGSRHDHRGQKRAHTIA